MSKPIIAVYAITKDWQLEEIKATAKDYDVRVKDEIRPEDIKNIEIVYGWGSELSENIADLKQLKWIQKDTAGLDAIPESLRKDKDIFLSNMSGVHAVPITENIFGYILGVARGIIPAMTNQLESKWDKSIASNMFSLKDKKVLVYGTGSIGQEIARTAKFFEMATYGVNSNGRSIQTFDHSYTMESSQDILSDMDFVINALPLTDESELFFDKEIFANMKDTAYFLNIGRGESVKDEHLIEELEAGTLAGAYLDVTSPEPLPESSKLWQTQNLVITPHISGNVEHFRDMIYPIFKENLDSYLSNGTLAKNEYNKKKGY